VSLLDADGHELRGHDRREADEHHETASVKRRKTEP
jgi:hypothetical protein